MRLRVNNQIPPSVLSIIIRQVYTFGCNDEGSLGRQVDEEEECFVPGKVNI